MTAIFGNTETHGAKKSMSWVCYLHADLRKLYSQFPYFFFYEARTIASKATKSFHSCSANRVQYCCSWTPETWECSPVRLQFQLTELKVFPLNGPAHRGKHLSRVSHHVQTSARVHCTRQCCCSYLMVNLHSCGTTFTEVLGKSKL